MGNGTTVILKQVEGLEAEVVTAMKFPSAIPVEDRVARLEKIVRKLLATSASLVNEVSAAQSSANAASATASAATGEIKRLADRIDRLERHLLDFMKAKGGPGYWYLDPQ